VWRGLRVALQSRDGQHRLLAVGLTCALGLYAALHAMVCTRLMPTTGLPMPFVSYGGSNLTFSMVALGLLLNLSRRVDEEELVVRAPNSPFVPPSVRKGSNANASTTTNRRAWA
jgi:cell division protein FtsW (lipid II flippase)